MRTTIDLPDDLHKVARSLARDEGLTLSQIVVRLLRQALGQSPAARIEVDPKSGLPSMRIGRIVTSDDVCSLEDEE